MAIEKRMLFYFDDVVMAIAKVFKGRLDDCIYSPNEVLSAVQGISPVDAVEVVHGHWIPIPEHENKRCSVCRKVFSDFTLGYYCPNCGAKMDGDGNEKM